MNRQPSILVYGRDWNLLQTRAWVLQRAGFRVDVAIDPAEAAQVLSAEQLDLLVLCHTLPEEEYRRSLAAARSLQPRIRSLSMAPRTLVCFDGPLDFTANTFEGPAALLATAETAISAADRPGI